MPQYVRQVEIHWTGLNRLRAMLDVQGNERALQAGLDDVSLDVEARAKANAPRKTGTLARSIHVWGRRSGPTRTIIAGTGVKYAAAQESGAGLWGPDHAKYPITPKRGKFLIFPSQMALTARRGNRAKLQKTLSGRAGHRTRKRYGNDALIFTKLVMHPGFPGTFYMKKAIEDSPMGDLLAKAMVRYWRTR